MGKDRFEAKRNSRQFSGFYKFQSGLPRFTKKIKTFQFVCKNDPFDDENRVRIVNDYKINCDLLQINSTFFDEFKLWDKSSFNVTWVLENRKLALPPDEYDSRFDLTPDWNIGFKPSEDLENITGFNWCYGQPTNKPQGIFWEHDHFIIVHATSIFNRFAGKFYCLLDLF